MSHTLEVHPQEGYVRATISVDTTRAIASEVAVHVINCMRDNQLTAALIDFRGCRYIDTLARNFQFHNEELPTLELRKSDQIAYLISPGDTTHNFSQLAAVNAGYDVRIFESEADALDWFQQS